MLFWILVAVAILVVLIAFIWGCNDDGFGFGLIAGFTAVLISALVCGLFFIIVAANHPMQPLAEKSVDHTLQALGTDDEISGRSYFLGGGYLNQEPVFSYIREGDSGGFVLRQVDADVSVVYQGAYEPHLTVHTVTWGDPWIHPWTEDMEDYTFYVPEGSVSNSISVEP